MVEEAPGDGLLLQELYKGAGNALLHRRLDVQEVEEVEGVQEVEVEEVQKVEEVEEVKEECMK